MKILLDFDENVVIILGKLVEMKKQTNPIRFPFDRNKAIQAILWLLHTNKGTMDKIKLIKLFFLADRAHLAKYGRPIAGGNYYNMDHGPVLSELKEILDEHYNASQNAPFTLNTEHLITAQQNPDDATLSESDLRILDAIYRKYGHYASFKLVDFIHTLKVYDSCKPPAGGRKDLTYEGFFLDLDNDAQEMLDLIREQQEALGIID